MGDLVNQEKKHELPAASADGVRNGFYHFCRVQDQNRPFASCVNIIEREGDAYIQAKFPECIRASAQCEARAMRKEELETGKAIYFIERQRFGTIEKTAIARSEEFISAVVTPNEQPQTAVVVSIIDQIEGEGSSTYGDLLTAMSKKEQIKVPSMTIMPGETPLQAARRVMSERGQQ